MNFVSDIGIGEVCIYNDPKIGQSRQMNDLLVKVVAITFDHNGVTCLCETVTGNNGVQRFVAFESQLTGDPEFDQNTGSYPDE